MKGELKAGGLALVVKSTDAHEVGRAVTLLQKVTSDDEFTAPDGTVCRWPRGRPDSWLVDGDVQCNMPGGSVFYGWAVFPPSHLMPIDGDDHQERDQLAKDKPAELTA